MAEINELTQWEPGIYQYETDDPVEGGPDGIDNIQGKQLANRTQWLKAQLASLGIGKEDADPTLVAIAALVGAADKLAYFNGPDTAALTAFTAFARTLLACADAASVRAALSAVSQADLNAAVANLVNSSPAALDTLKELADALGDDPNFAATMTNALAGKQASSAALTALAGLVTAADKLIYATGANTFATATLTAFARSLIATATAADARAALSAVSQTEVQQELSTSAIAGGTADAITAAFNPAITSATLAVGTVTLTIWPTAANATAAPTFTPNAGVVPAWPIVKGNNKPLAPGDIAGAGHPITLQVNYAAQEWVLLNPATPPGAVVTISGTQTMAGQKVPSNGALADAASISWDCAANGQIAAVTLSGNRTMAAPANIQQYGLYILRVTQDATGSRTLAYNTAYKFGTAGAPALTTTAGKTDILTFMGGAANTLEFMGIRKDAV